ncbi:MAG: ORF6N domain-containing protein [Elusimicrobiales bacterium]
MKALISLEPVEQRIYLIRGHRVILDFDLAALYDVETKALKRVVRRNISRFPSDFMFQLSSRELQNLRCQIGTSKWGGQRYLPFAFTEQGVAMLSGVINSNRAVQVNIAIMRTFVKLRETLALHKELAKKFQELERKIVHHDEQIQSIFEAIRQLMSPPDKDSKKVIGFQP